MNFPNLDGVTEIAVDCETKDPNLLTLGPGGIRGDGHLLGVSLAWRDPNPTPLFGLSPGLLHSIYLPVGHPEGNLDPTQVNRYLNDVLGKGVPTVYANAAYDLEWLTAWGVQIVGPKYDVQIAEALLNENLKTYKLQSLADRYIGGEGKKSGDMIAAVVALTGCDPKAAMGEIWRLPARAVEEYARVDTELTLQVWESQWPLLKNQGLCTVWKLETDLIDALQAIRFLGMPINVGETQALQAELARDEVTCSLALNNLVGQAVNPWSHDEVTAAAHKLGLRGLLIEDRKVIKESFPAPWMIQQKHEFFSLLVKLRQLSKVGGTFLETFLQRQVNGRIRCQYHQTRGDRGGTRSGRLSASQPNLQQIPSRNMDLAPRIRALFKPEPGLRLAALDHSQVEPRITVHYAKALSLPGSAEAVRRYSEGDVNYHQLVADMMQETNGALGLSDKQMYNAAKQMNLGLCIAEGQRVLTDKGLVRIENMTTELSVWDGVEWVSHDGLIYQGSKEVITYDGVTATPDHDVFTNIGKVSLGEAASRLATLTTTGVGRDAVRSLDSGFSGDPERQEEPEGACAVSLWDDQVGSQGQPGSRFVYPLPIMSTKVSAPGGSADSSSVRRYCVSLHTFFRSLLSQLWGPRYSEFVSFSGSFCGLRSGKPASPGLPKAGHRQAEQRRTLCSGEPALVYAFGEPAQPKRFTKVYDLMNAGPRRRFTVEGKLVSNCYGMGQAKMADTLGMTLDEAGPLFRAYHQGVPFIKALGQRTSAAATSRGYIKTVLGRFRRFNLYGPTKWEKGVVPLPHEEALAKWGPSAVRYFTHKAMNALVQGTAADLLKKNMVDLHAAGHVPHLSIHDELVFSVDPGTSGALAISEIKSIMEGSLTFAVPLRAAVKVGEDWGNMSKWEGGE